MAKKSNNYSIQKIVSSSMIITLVLGFVTGYFVATLKSKVELAVVKTETVNRDDAISQMKQKMNRVTMWGGKMLRMMDGNFKELTDEVILSDGTKVTTNGVVNKEGKMIYLKDGDSVMMNGEIVSQ